ncbi:hypothetical protein DFR55_15211 [Herbinix hemicellulosilytica]|uniref:Uncharacterized protein n=1 Tax=Herbinix hemicellulosilytica TaxID=1564487 RepID=A0A0H5SU71_HERHM|nr:hypothetical protein [Herbinix hemicellulosilytica]RBP55976.1 hypothetical protein DFR55_15211 [Herbinix hemicellulosilytica]CRZ33868.1 hypothetical protein HHT355_0664 [Herbinix hemicellulosilytica]
MDLINIEVIHRTYGEGIVVSHDGAYITVKFLQGEKVFPFPNAFDGYLKAKNESIAENINNILQNYKEEKNAEKMKLIEKECIQYKYEQAKFKTKIYTRANVAFKCNFCDGGRSEKQIGYNGVCSDNIIFNNIVIEKRTWCSSDDSPCNQYLKGIINRYELDDICSDGGFVCYESQMLRDWKAYAGIVQTGEKKGQPMKLNQVQKNSLCILTTRDPNSNESERYIFGVFLVGQTYEGDHVDEGYVISDSKYRIKLSPEEAHKMLFWNYHANINQPDLPKWSSGLHRYFGDDQAVQILQDIIKIKTGTKEKELAEDFYSYFININGIDVSDLPEKNGALLR